MLIDPGRHNRQVPFNPRVFICAGSNLTTNMAKNLADKKEPPQFINK